MTDVGGISSDEFAEIWAEMAAAEKQATEMEKRLIAIHKNLDGLLGTLPETEEKQGDNNAASQPTETNIPK